MEEEEHLGHRIHLFGASGSGTTTLGRALSDRLGIPHFDTDDYFWVKTTPVPFTVKTDVSQRVGRLRDDLLKYPEWVLSGSLCDWGDFAIPLFTLAVFLWIPADIRMYRIKEREIDRYGIEALSPGGWFHKNHVEFMAYAASYDSGGLDIRSRELHERWMGKLPCRLLRIEEPLSTHDQIAVVERELGLMESASGTIAFTGTIEIRRLTSDDADSVLEVYRQSEDFLALGSAPWASMEMVLADMETSTREGGIFCGIYSQDASMIGVVDFVPGRSGADRRQAFISLLMIAKPYRGKGLGTEIVKTIENEIASRGLATRVRTAVQVNNPDTLRFWQRNGYHIVGGPERQPDGTTVFHLERDLSSGRHTR